MAPSTVVGPGVMLSETAKDKAVGLFDRVRSRCGVSLMLVGLVALCALLMVACNEDDSGVGPGPVGPVGPVGSDEEGIPGSGRITTETTQVGDFDRLTFSSEGTVILTQEEKASLSIEADDNLHQYVTTSVLGGELAISTAGGTDIAPSRSIVFRVEVVDLSGIELAGVGTISAEKLDGTAVAVILSGTGDITIDQLQAEQVTVDHSGVGTVRLVGEVGEQRVAVSGVGGYDGSELASRIGQVEAWGTGKAMVWVTDELQLVVSESGAVEFYGSPTVNQEVSGSGTATPLGDK
jgi:hypothetical protein